MRRLLKSLTDLSLFQQMSVIVVTLGVILIFFFSVYQKGNISEFVDGQVVALLHRSQNTVAMNILDNDKISTDFSYDQDVMHFVYINNKCAQFYSNGNVDAIYNAELYRDMLLEFSNILHMFQVFSFFFIIFKSTFIIIIIIYKIKATSYIFY